METCIQTETMACAKALRSEYARCVEATGRTRNLAGWREKAGLTLGLGETQVVAKLGLDSKATGSPLRVVSQGVPGSDLHF